MVNGSSLGMRAEAAVRQQRPLLEQKPHRNPRVRTVGLWRPLLSGCCCCLPEMKAFILLAELLFDSYQIK